MEGNERYSMYTRDGNHLVSELMVEVREKLGAGMGRKNILEFLKEGMSLISNGGHEEVYDTAVKEGICYDIDDEFEEEGYVRIDVKEI